MPKPEEKILRVGIIQGGKIIEERLLRKREAVTIGQSPKNTFYIPSSRLPRSMTIFDVKGDRYVLSFDDEMQGRISLQEEVFQLSQVKAHPDTSRKGSTSFLLLDEKSRGKVVLGDITILFQFVPMPPVVPRPQLPASAKGGIGVALAENSSFLLALLLAFVLQTTTVVGAGLLYEPPPTITKKMRYLSKLQVDVQFKETIEEKKDDNKKEPDKPAEDQTEDDPAEDLIVEDVEIKKKPEPKKVRKKLAQKKNRPRKRNRAQNERNRRVKVRNKLLTSVLLSKGKGKGGINNLRSGHARTKEIFGDQKRMAGLIDKKPGDFKGYQDQPSINRGGGAAKLRGLSKKDKRRGQLKTATVKVAKKRTEMKIRLRLGSSRKTGGIGQLSGASVTSVFRRRRNAFRRCYEKRLNARPNLKGKVVIRFTIGTTGRITNIGVASNSTGDSAVGQCIVRKVRGWKFRSPEGGSAKFKYPIVLSRGG